MNDQELLQAYVTQRDEQAFRVLVERYVPIVHAAARRQVPDAHLAEDVTQAVFIMLTRKAHSIHGASLAGWLVKASRFAAQAANRAEVRRKRREKRFAAMTTLETQDQDAVVQEEIGRDVDHGLSRLGEKDRTAITLRFLQNKPLRDVAEQMGISEAAATKRVNRALAKLRKFFTRRGIEITPMALGGLIEAQTGHTSTNLLVEKVTAATLSSPPSTAAVTSANTIADTALRAMAIKALSPLAAAAVVALLVGAVGVLSYARTSSAVAWTAPPERVLPALNLEPVNVGVYLSRHTALFDENGAPAGYGSQVRNLKELKKWPDLHLIPLIEPGSNTDEELAKRLRFHFVGVKPLEVTDLASLKKLDVIVVNAVCSPPDEALRAVDEAVRSGTGLVVRQCFGGCDQGYGHPLVCELRGFETAQWAGGSGDVDCEIVGSNPILGSISAHAGTSIPMRVYGPFGKPLPNTVPLIKAKSSSSFHGRTGEALPAPENFVMYPLYLSELEKGRIVSCSIANNVDTPAALQDATGGQFMRRAVRWAARRPVE
jgi:RNA polymerase sigma factor (sigma-70 family)